MGEASHGGANACVWGSSGYCKAHGRQNRSQQDTEVCDMCVVVVILVALGLLAVNSAHDDGRGHSP